MANEQQGTYQHAHARRSMTQSLFSHTVGYGLSMCGLADAEALHLGAWWIG